MELRILTDNLRANAAATDCLAGWLTSPGTRTFMPAAGNRPIELYRRIGERGLALVTGSPKKSTQQANPGARGQSGGTRAAKHLA